ncbi:intermembrane phospholipid transport protein YdbH family protein [Alcanivorax sp.]|uniref:intermembrane phospholipid transport protein YdbH family protein n=1 Tax=Alcanivorax sp. TaxID=1872427 RepID=UPI003A90430C
MARFSPRMLRRWAYGLLLLLATMLLLILVAVGWAYGAGVRVSEPGWQQGLTLGQWRLIRDNCVAARGTDLTLEDVWPLKIKQRLLAVYDCRAGNAPESSSESFPDGLPWTPPFDLQVAELDLSGLIDSPLPVMAMQLHQQEQHWQLQASAPQAALQAQYQRAQGHWMINSEGALSTVLPDWQGQWQLHGEGSWQGEPDGKIRLDMLSAGPATQSQRADLTAQAHFQGADWQLQADLAQPLALNNDWQLTAAEPLAVAGSGVALVQASAALQLAGPPGKVTLQAHSDSEATIPAGLEQGRGTLRLQGDSLGGQVDFHWQDRVLVLEPASLSLPQNLTAQWQEPLQIPMARSGRTDLPLRLGYDGLNIKTGSSQVRWQLAAAEGASQVDWQWAGDLVLRGQWQGYQVQGEWQGAVGSHGLEGDPIRLTARQGNDRLAFLMPVSTLQQAPYGAEAKVTGNMSGYPLDGTLAFAQSDAGWAGTLQASTTLPQFERGGQVTVKAPWSLADGTVSVAAGSQASISEGLIGQALIRPVSLRATGPLQINGQGVTGTVAIHGGGLLAARWRLPPISGTATMKGEQVQGRLTVSEWQSELRANGALEKNGGASGTLTMRSALVPAMGVGLDATPRQGQLQGKGRWQWRQTLKASGDITLTGADLDWGSVTARGAAGVIHGEYNNGDVQLSSTGPVTVDTLDIGTPITDLALTVNSDLSQWQFTDVRADLLGGYLRSPALDWPSARPQPVVISRIDLAQVAALQNPPPVSLSGRIGGYVPLQLGADFLAIEEGRLANEEPLSLIIPASSSVQAMADSNQAVKLALDSLSSLLISDFQARMAMDKVGWLDAAITIKGINPQRKNLPVVFNYTHRENVLALMRSLRIGDEITEQLRTENR